MKGGKNVVSILMDQKLLNSLLGIYNEETNVLILYYKQDNILRVKIIKFWKILIDNCFLKVPKDLAIEEVETNFGFLNFSKPEGGEESKGKEVKMEEKLLNKLLHKEAKIPPDTPKHFQAKDFSLIASSCMGILNGTLKHLDPKTPQAKTIEKAEILLLYAKLVRLGNEDIHNFFIKALIIEKSIVILNTQNYFYIATSQKF